MKAKVLWMGWACALVLGATAQAQDEGAEADSGVSHKQAGEEHRAEAAPPTGNLPGGIPGTVAGHVAFTTDYVWRGVSQSDEDVAVQGDFAYTVAVLPGTSFYASVWATNVEFNEGASDNASVEMDFFGGFTGTLPTLLPRLTWDIGGLHYYYPGSNDPALNHFDFTEVYGGLTYDFGVASVNFYINHSPDFFAETGDSTYYSTTVKIPLPKNFGIALHAGDFDFDDNALVGLPDYVDWKVGVTAKLLNFFDLDLSYIDTDISQRRCFGGLNWCDGRVVFSVSHAF